MTSTTLEQYLKSAFERDQIDHRLRVHVTPDGKATFYIHPHAADGETRDFVVRGNAVAPNLNSDSDVVGAVAYSGNEQAKEPNLIGEASMASVGCAGYATNPIDDAVRLSHAAANVAEALAEVHTLNADAENGLSALVVSLATKARAALGEIDVVGPVQIAVIGDVGLEVAGSVSLNNLVPNQPRGA